MNLFLTTQKYDIYSIHSPNAFLISASVGKVPLIYLMLLCLCSFYYTFQYNLLILLKTKYNTRLFRYYMYLLNMPLDSVSDMVYMGI